MSPHRRPVPIWYVLLAVLVSVLAVSGATLAYAAHIQRESDRQWCELFDIMTADSPPPSTERGRDIAEALERRRQTLGCKP